MIINNNENIYKSEDQENQMDKWTMRNLWLHINITEYHIRIDFWLITSFIKNLKYRILNLENLTFLDLNIDMLCILHLSQSSKEYIIPKIILIGQLFYLKQFYIEKCKKR